MRRPSQEVFALFKRTYIDRQRNFFAEVSDAPVADFLGEVSSQLGQHASSDTQSEHDAASLARRISSARTLVKSFVIYQLSNPQPQNGSGVGCGYYDEHGAGDGGGITRLMNSLIMTWWMRPLEWFWFGQNLHSIHHLFPRVPFYRYHELHRRIEPAMRAHGTPMIGIFSRRIVESEDAQLRTTESS
jgi:hypothetical protein